MECPICIETVLVKNVFNCIACKFKNCIDCHKKYLLNSTQDQHCINCRAIIPYDLFLDKFNKRWIFGEYKKHRYSVLWEREQSLLPETVYIIANKKKQKNLEAIKEKLLIQAREIQNQIRNLQLNQFEKQKNEKFSYTYACPKDNCKGFLNSKFECALCESLICDKCYTHISGIHQCNPEMIETFKTIKKESKPCPCCGEFISKTYGCDQMFCIKCGTAFSWKTGLVEKGIIHNPYAHTFFENNPDARINYQNRFNNNICRTHIPSIIQMNLIRNNIKDESIDFYLKESYRHIAEFRHYARHRFLAYINTDRANTQDLRIKFLKNEIEEEAFKKTLHLRDKKRYFNKQLCQTFIFAFDIAEYLLWNMFNTDYTDSLILNKNIKSLIDFYEDTNKNIDTLSKQFGYKNIYKMEKYYAYPVFL